MGLASTIALRSLRQKPGRTFFSVAGIAVGIATVVGIFTLDHNTLLDRTQTPESEWEAEIEVRPSRGVENPRERLREIPGILGVTAAFQKVVSLRPAGADGTGTNAALVAIEPETAASLEALQLLEGRQLSAQAAPSSAREVLIGRRLAETLELSLGSTVELARPVRGGGVSRECVDGEWVELAREPKRAADWETFTVAGILAPEGIGRKGSGEVAIISYADGLALFEGTHVATHYWLRRDPSINVERLQAGLGEAWSYDLKKSVIIGQAADERAFRNGVRFAGLLALVLGLFVIFHTLSMSLVERVREVGMLHALGATRAQIARIFLLEASIIAGLGGVCGFLGGLAMAKALLEKGITTVGVGRHIELFEVPWGMAAPLTLVGVGIALLGSVYPLARARNTDAVSALRGVDRSGEAAHPGQLKGGRGFQVLAALLLALVLPAVYFFLVPVVGETEAELVGVLMLGLGILALFVIVPLLAPRLLSFVCVRLARIFEQAWPLAGKLAARTMTDTPARVAGAAAGIALVTAGFVGLRVMTRGLEGEIRVWSQEAFRDKIYVSDLPATDFETLSEHLRSYPGVLGVEPNEARTYAPFLVIGLKEAELSSYGPCRDDPDLVRAMREERGIILSRRVAKHRDYELGDLVHVEAADGDVESFPVVAISDAYGYFPHPDERLYGVVSDHWMEKMFCIDVASTTEVAVRLERGMRPTESKVLVETAVAALFPNAKPRYDTGHQLYYWHVGDIARDFVLFDIIIALTVMLAGLGVLNGQLLSALERAKELGVLKALGTTRRQVAGMVLLESGVVGLVGGGLGVAMGSLLGPFIVAALKVISGLDLPQRGPGLHVLWAWIGAVLVALLAGLYPIWRMNRADAIAAVRLGG